MFQTGDRKKHEVEISAWLTAYAERNEMTMDELASILMHYQDELQLICVVRGIRDK